jgi:hypothetical protein
MIPSLEFLYTDPLALVIVIVLALNAGNIFSNYVLRNALEKGLPLPKRLSDFPVHSTSTGAYIASFHKVETFMQQVLESISAELWLNSDDINNIYLKGITIDKYRVSPKSDYVPFFIPKFENDFFYFELQEHTMMYKRIRYPTLEGEDGISSETMDVQFEKVDQKYRMKLNCIELHGKDVAECFRSNPIYQFLAYTELMSPDNMGARLGLTNFLFHIMGVTQSPKDDPRWCSDSLIHQRASMVIEKIQSIEIIDKFLIITAH